MHKEITVEQIDKALELFIKNGFEVIQLNLILFPPTTTVEDVVETMKKAVDYAGRPGVFLNVIPCMGALPKAPLMDMPEYQDLITWKKKELPGGQSMMKPAMIKIKDGYAAKIFDISIREAKDEENSYNAMLVEKKYPFSSTPEYIWPLLYFKTIYRVLSREENTGKYDDEIARIDGLVEKLTLETVAHQRKVK